MPRVGDKEFPYTEEGMAAAEAEAAATGLEIEIDDAASQLPQEEIAPPEEEVLEEAVEETEEPAEPAEMPDEAIMGQLFEVVFGATYDPDSPEAQEQMQQLMDLLSSDPRLTAALASGELSVSEFAIQLYRVMEEKRATRAAEQAVGA